MESYRRLIMQWILPIKVQLARQVRDGSAYVDSKLGCLSRLTGCSKQKIAFIFVAAGVYVAANIISNVEDGVKLIEKIGVKFGKASDAVFEVAEDSATEAVDAAVNMFGGEAAGSPPPPNVLLPDYWELLSDFEIPFHHFVPNIQSESHQNRHGDCGYGCPNNFELIVVRHECRFQTRSAAIFVRVPEQGDMGENENDTGDQDKKKVFLTNSLTFQLYSIFEMLLNR